MQTYNFKTKAIGTIFDGIKWVAKSSNFTGLDAKTSECSIIELFGQKLVGYPAKALGNCVILQLYSNGTDGQLFFNQRKYSFSIHGDILYLTAW
jgi:hypothetical protein